MQEQYFILPLSETVSNYGEFFMRENIKSTRLKKKYRQDILTDE